MKCEQLLKLWWCWNWFEGCIDMDFLNFSSFIPQLGSNKNQRFASINCLDLIGVKWFFSHGFSQIHLRQLLPQFIHRFGQRGKNWSASFVQCWFNVTKANYAVAMSVDIIHDVMYGQFVFEWLLQNYNTYVSDSSSKMDLSCSVPSSALRLQLAVKRRFLISTDESLCVGFCYSKPIFVTNSSTSTHWFKTCEERSLQTTTVFFVPKILVDVGFWTSSFFLQFLPW